MFKTLVTTTALAVGAVALPLSASAQTAGAPATPASPAAAVNGTQWHVKLFGGIDKIDDVEDSYYGYDAEISAESGFVVGAAVGVTLGDFLVEAEIAHRKSDLDEISVGGLSTSLDDSDVTATSLMANAWYQFPMAAKTKFYVGGGVGMVNAELSVAGYSEDSSEFGWQLGAGVSHELGNGLSIGAGYRYFNVELEDLDSDIKSNSFIVEVTKKF